MLSASVCCTFAVGKLGRTLPSSGSRLLKKCQVSLHFVHEITFAFVMQHFSITLHTSILISVSGAVICEGLTSTRRILCQGFTCVPVQLITGHVAGRSVYECFEKYFEAQKTPPRPKRPAPEFPMDARPSVIANNQCLTAAKKKKAVRSLRWQVQAMQTDTDASDLSVCC